MYTVFISYAHIDTKQADLIENAFHIAGINVARDKTFVREGTAISDVIKKNIDSSDEVLVLLSKSAKQSDWVPAELDRARDNKKFVTYVRLDETQRLQHNFEGGDFYVPDFSKWNGDPNADICQELLSGIRQRVLQNLRQDLETELKPRFVLEDGCLSFGRLAAVFKAKDTLLDRWVAVKSVHNKDYRPRFVQGVKAAIDLSDEQYFISVYDARLDSAQGGFRTLLIR